LPWQGLHGKNNEEKYKMILEKKSSTTLEELCMDLPGIRLLHCCYYCFVLICHPFIRFFLIEEFLAYFRTVTALEFDQTPDYNGLKNIFKQLFIQNKYSYENILYDWEVIAYQKKK
jgi:casein kinase 1